MTIPRGLPAVTLSITAANPGDQVRLRPLLPRDAPAVAALADDPLVLRWLPMPQPYTLADARQYCEVVAPEARADGRGGVWAVLINNHLAGLVNLRKVDRAVGSAEIGYWTGAFARGRGVTTRAAQTLSRWALTEAGLNRVELRAPAGNTGSNRVAIKAGFRLEGTLRQAAHTRSGLVDLKVYGRLARDLAGGHSGDDAAASEPV